MTVVFAGPIRAEDARGVVERAFRIPPALPGEAPAAPDEAPVLPLQQRVPGGITVTLLGYLLDRADLGACEPVAALLELRLALALQVGGPMVPGVSVGCHTLRGNPFVVAAVYTTTFDAGDLPREVDDAFAALVTVPPTAAERAAVNGRLERRERRLLADPELLAERVAALVAFRGDPRPLGDRIGFGRLPDAAALRRFAARSLAKERRILVNVSPLQE
jgi:predicted Zn-dependent peptidase